MSEQHLLIVGCGDIGIRTARRIKSLAPAIMITGLRRTPPVGNESSDSSGVDQWLAADISQPESLSRLQTLAPDLTHVLFTLTPAGRDEAGYRKTYLHGLQNVMQAISPDRLERVVYVSSSAVYGEHHGDWVDERTPEAPAAYNGRVLLEAERWLHQQGFSSTALRLAGIYGPGRTQLLDRIAAGEARAPVHPVHWANRIHADDAAAACACLLLAPRVEHTYLGVDDTPLPLHTLYADLATMLNGPAPREGEAPAHVGSKRLNNARLKSLGWKPAHPDARQGYRALIDLKT